MIEILWEYWVCSPRMLWACLQKGYTPQTAIGVISWQNEVRPWLGDLRYVRRRGLGSHDGELFFFVGAIYFTEKVMSTRRLLLFIPTGTRSERNTCGSCGPFFPRVVKKGKSWHRQTCLGSLICQVIFLRKSHEYFCPVTIIWKIPKDTSNKYDCL